MRCSKAERYIDLSLDGELESSRQAVLNDHLKTCAACRTRFANAEKLHTQLSAANLVEFPSWVHAQIMDKVHRLDDKRPGFVRRFKLAPAGALLAIMLSFWAGANVGITGYNKTFVEPTTSNSSLTTASNVEFGENSLLNIWSENGDINE